MELRQLEYFQMASRLKNITRAAERLRVSQPNITVAIKKLESELGIQLFDRSQKQLSLTPEGAVFLERVEVALRNIQDAVLEINDYKQLLKGPRPICSSCRWHAVRSSAVCPRTATLLRARRSPCRTSRITTSSC